MPATRSTWGHPVSFWCGRKGATRETVSSAVISRMRKRRKRPGFHTGDVVYAGENGLLYFFDRKKSIVRRSGENIAVLEVEAALAKLPGIKASAVTPVPDDLRGEEVFAFIVEAEVTAGGALQQRASRIIEACGAYIAYHKRPGYVVFIEKLPVSSTQKVQRGEIKTMAAKAVEDGSAIDLRKLKAMIRKGG